MRKNLLILLFTLLCCTNNVNAQIDASIYESGSKFGTMWWLNTINNPKQMDFAIQTTDYGMLMDYNKLQFNGLWVNEKPMSESEFLSTNPDEVLRPVKGSELTFGTSTKKGVRNELKPSGQLKNCQLVVTGRYIQKRFINELKGEERADKIKSGLELYSYTDFFSLKYIFKAKEDIKDMDLFLDFKFPENFNRLKKTKEGYITVASSKSKGGFVVFPSEGTTSIKLEKGAIKSISENPEYKHNKDYQVGIQVHVLLDMEAQLDSLIAARKSTPIRVEASIIKPEATKLHPVFNADQDAFDIRVMMDTKHKYTYSDLTEHVVLELTNESDFSKQTRLNLRKFKQSTSITGISGILCDLDGTPMGIPVQISKNWHREKKEPQRYEGSWISMYTNVTVPANTTVKLLFKYFTGYWGTLPTASHAQLSLVGWGNSVQLWDQSALGSWGESICYSPDANVGNATITDVRPAFITNAKGSKFKWGGNIGGGDFLNVTDFEGKRIHVEDIRIKRARYAPNLTEMVQHGTLANGALEFEYSSCLARTNDMVKGRYNIKIKVVRDFSFANFAIFQAGAYGYAFADAKVTSYGNEDGMKKTWNTEYTTPINNYVKEKFTIGGKNEWVAQTQNKLTNPGDKLSANRGIILRDWDAKIAGKKGEVPHWGEFMVGRGPKRQPRTIINLALPNGCTKLKEGDYINASIDMIIFHQQPETYCADNDAFLAALTAHPDSWELVLRDAKENDHKVNVTKGKLTRERPIRIEAKDNVVEGSILGGLAYEPITFTGLTTYKLPTLSYKDPNGKWIVVDQSREGKDFWQCDFNGETQKWEITYNIPLDRKDNTKAREFRFEVK